MQSQSIFCCGHILVEDLQTVPDEGSIYPAIMPNTVDFPAPLCPIIAIASSSLAFSSKSLTTYSEEYFL